MEVDTIIFLWIVMMVFMVICIAQKQNVSKKRKTDKRLSRKLDLYEFSKWLERDNWNRAQVQNATTKALWHELMHTNISENFVWASMIEEELKRRGEWGKYQQQGR